MSPVPSSSTAIRSRWNCAASLPNLLFFSAGSITLALGTPLGKAVQPRAGATEVIFPVESVAAAHALLRDRGCTFINEPREVTPGSWAASFTDPEGHRLTIFGAK